VHEPSFKVAIGLAAFAKSRLIVTVDDRALHEARDTPVEDAVQAVTDLFHVCFWRALTYGRSRPADDLALNPKLNRKDDNVKQTTPACGRWRPISPSRDGSLAEMLRDREQLVDDLICHPRLKRLKRDWVVSRRYRARYSEASRITRA
jgi:type I restriction enzyme R subunit